MNYWGKAKKNPKRIFVFLLYISVCVTLLCTGTLHLPGRTKCSCWSSHIRFSHGWRSRPQVPEQTIPCTLPEAASSVWVLVHLGLQRLWGDRRRTGRCRILGSSDSYLSNGKFSEADCHAVNQKYIDKTLLVLKIGTETRFPGCGAYAVGTWREAAQRNLGANQNYAKLCKRVKVVWRLPQEHHEKNFWPVANDLFFKKSLGSLQTPP